MIGRQFFIHSLHDYFIVPYLKILGNFLVNIIRISENCTCSFSIIEKRNFKLKKKIIFVFENNYSDYKSILEFSMYHNESTLS